MGEPSEIDDLAHLLLALGSHDTPAFLYEVVVCEYEEVNDGSGAGPSPYGGGDEVL